MREKLENYIRRHQILTFIAMTFLICWILWAILYSPYVGIIDRKLYQRGELLFICIGGFMPSTISIVLTALIYKKEGVKKLFKE